MELQTSTCDLVERFKRGEQGAFSLLFGKYRRRLAVLLHYRMSEDFARPAGSGRHPSGSFSGCCSGTGTIRLSISGEFHGMALAYRGPCHRGRGALREPAEAPSTRNVVVQVGK